MRIIAHRSGPDIYPEQTILSALRALEMGADMIELDTRFSKDGKIVVSHDLNTSRVFGEDLNTCDITAEKFLSLRHKDRRAFASHLFEDYLSGGVYPILIHIKEGKERIRELIDVIRKYDYSDKVYLGAGCLDDVKVIKQYAPELKVLAFAPKEESVLCAEAGADAVRLWESWNFTAEKINEIKKYGKEVWIMAMSEGMDVGYTNKGNLKKWESMGADGVLLNDMNFAKEEGYL